jgi:hypothetical protein
VLYVVIERLMEWGTRGRAKRAKGLPAPTEEHA